MVLWAEGERTDGDRECTWLVIGMVGYSDEGWQG
jgi:hypothetical protein